MLEDGIQVVEQPNWSYGLQRFTLDCTYKTDSEVGSDQQPGYVKY